MHRRSPRRAVELPPGPEVNAIAEDSCVGYTELEGVIDAFARAQFTIHFRPQRRI